MAPRTPIRRVKLWSLFVDIVGMWPGRHKAQPGTRLEEHSVIWIRSHHDPEVLRSELVPDAYVVHGLREGSAHYGHGMHMPHALEEHVRQDREVWSKPYAADREIDVADRNGRPLFSGLEFGPIDPALRAEVVHFRRAWGAAGVFDYPLGTDRKHVCCRPKKVTVEGQRGYKTSRWLLHGTPVDGWPGWHTETTRWGVTTDRRRLKEMPSRPVAQQEAIDTPEGLWIFGRKGPAFWHGAGRTFRQDRLDRSIERLGCMLEANRQSLANTSS